MDGGWAHAFAVEIATSFGLVGLLAAVAIATVLNVTALVGAKKRVRPAVLGAYALLAAGVAGGYAVGVPEAAGEAQASAPRVAGVDDEMATGSLSAATVFIQTPDMDARFAADGMWRALKSAGFRTPGIELVAGGAPSRAQVRYFDDADRPTAERVAAIAAGQGLQGATVRRAAAASASARGRIELWYPR